jgi:RNA polymerase sigma-70 factor (ECF subfamily)
VRIDGMPGVAAVLDGRVVSLMAFALRGGRIAELHVLADPARIAKLGAEGVIAQPS